MNTLAKTRPLREQLARDQLALYEEALDSLLCHEREIVRERRLALMRVSLERSNSGRRT